jgi:hypothetical protein
VRASVAALALDPLRPPLGAWPDRVVSNRLPGRRWRKLVPGSLRRSGWVLPSRRQGLSAAGQGRGHSSSTCGARAPPGRRYPLDGPRRRIHPGPGGCPPYGSELALRLIPFERQGPRGHRRASRVAPIECGRSAWLSPSEPTGSTGLRAVTVRKRALRDEQRRLRGAPVPAKGPGSHQAPSLRFSRSDLELRPWGSRPSNGGLPTIAGTSGTGPCRGSGRDLARPPPEYPKVHLRTSNLRSRARACARSRADPASDIRAQGSSDHSDDLHRRSAGRHPSDPRIGQRVSCDSSLGARSVKTGTLRREGRLQGLHPSTSLVRPPPVSGARAFRFSHGLCSPSRLPLFPLPARLPALEASLHRFPTRPPTAPRER